MVFVRWHYRDGAYVRSHYRRTRRPVAAGQRPLLALVTSDDTAGHRHDDVGGPQGSGMRYPAHSSAVKPRMTLWSAMSSNSSTSRV